MVEEGTFRQDLYYRVHVMVIHAPALREHPEDIPQLAHHFLEEYSRLYQRPGMRITPDAMAILLEYEWPGNVRELENAIQSAIILSDGHAVEPGNLPAAIPAGITGDGRPAPGASFEEQMQDYKVKLAQRAIHECQGNKTLAARSLHISRTYLHRLIRDPGEDEEMLPESMAG